MEDIHSFYLDALIFLAGRNFNLKICLRKGFSIFMDNIIITNFPCDKRLPPKPKLPAVSVYPQPETFVLFSIIGKIVFLKNLPKILKITGHFEGHWQNDKKQEVEILNYGRKWNYLHMFGNQLRHACMKIMT